MHSLLAIDHSYLIPLLPLLGAAVAGFFGARWLKGQSHWPIWIGVGASAVLSILLLVGMVRAQHHKSALTPIDGQGNTPYPYVKLTNATSPPALAASEYGRAASQDWYTWIEAGTFKATAGFWFDPLTAVMLCVVCGIGFLITVFAAGYMKGEEGYFRFFAYLGLFIFAMTILVMGNNFIMLYLGWEGVGLCSYLLIGYYYDKPAAREAAKKAFLVNRVGDFGFGLGIMLLYTAFGTVSYFGDAAAPGIFQLASNTTGFTAYQQWALNLAPFLLMIGAFGKSAQVPLHVWLPDAMEGPTPVSALIHAATMVTAGVYMIARCSTLFVTNEPALITVAVVGSFTALFAGLIALRQFDLKKVFAYSTVSQLGFMFVGVAVLAPVAAVFHLITHAFFKALLFLGSGVVMHAMAGELDLRRMSGLKRVLPKTRILMLIGCLALAGMIPLSGFWSKDEILIAAYRHNKLLGAVMLLTAFLTAYYSFRLYFRVFEGPEVIPAPPAGGHGHGHADDHAHASAAAVQAGTPAESGVDRHLDQPAAGHGHAAHGHAHDAHGHHNHEPMVMVLPLVILALGAVLAGALAYHHALGHFLYDSPSFAMGYNKARNFYLQKEGIAGIELQAWATRQDQTWPADVHYELDPAMWGSPEKMPGGEEAAAGVKRGIFLASILIAFLGILLAYLMHLKDRPRADRLAARFGGLTRLLEAKFWVDEVYQRGIVEPLRSLGRVFFAIDRYVVDGVVWLLGFVPQVFGFALKLTTQRGSLQGYAVMMVLGVALILLFILF